MCKCISLPGVLSVFRAADWNLASPDWRGRLKVVSKSGNCVVKLEDRNGRDNVCLGMAIKHAAV